jgi:hypothetical protein
MTMKEMLVRVLRNGEKQLEEITAKLKESGDLLIPKGQSGTEEHDRRSSTEGATGRALA